MSQEALHKLTDQWKNMNHGTEAGRQEAASFYDNELFPRIKEVFLSRPENRPERSYDALILPVGMSPEPLILSILAIRPKKVAFLYTPEVTQYLDRIMDETGLKLSQIEKEEIDGSDITAMYRIIMRFYEKWGHPENLAIDITGGKKSMVGGASMAGAVLGADIFYVDTCGYLPKLRRPEPGTEFLNRLPNPYAVFGELEVQNALSLYQCHDYQSAQRIFEELGQRVPGPEDEVVCRCWACLSATYEAWDNLRVKDAIASLNEALSLIRRYRHVPKMQGLAEHLPILDSQSSALKILDTILGNETAILTSPHGFHLAYTLYQNAMRREEQGKLDMAALLLYRLLEWIGQRRLASHGIRTSKPDYAQLGVSEENLAHGFAEKRLEIFPKQTGCDLPEKIGLMDGYILLSVLSDPIIGGIQWNPFKGLLDARNQSVLAHGFRQISQKTYQNFRQLVEGRLQKALGIEALDDDFLSQQHQFIRLD